ncbi:hypothetical protein Rhopal_000560-T1 [Rhodotorula paludigena]|uniref:Carboxymuconolactone decarboxylase-like domain-containing protein n=1 Tax=Rhodotorula paludigena TaxID=86838 RepID=A0AAV5G5E4_9BASI|nr:hypothetical protein Rhopal_000560-T1 [Rhodotorula paludigena]
MSSNDSASSAARQKLLDNSKAFLDSMSSEGNADKMLAAQSDFARPGFEYMLRGAFDGIWAREGLERNILASSGKISQLKSHVGMGLKNGLSEEEIRECLLHVMGYCGFPAGLDAFAAANEVIQQAKESK